jgi:type IV pilus assembly protein PilV
MKPTPRARRRRRQGGIALLEAMLAIVLLGVGLLGTIGLQARAYSALSDASMRAEAAIAGERLLGLVTSDLPNLSKYALAAGAAPNPTIKPWVDETLTHIPGAVLTVQTVLLERRTQMNVSISWQRKAKEEGGQHQMTFYIAD